MRRRRTQGSRKVGKVLRKYRIDELPQLLNVLKGEMSLIGPRPEREYYYRLYDKTMPEFRYRLNVKAGLSGYAQVWGRYNTKLREKLMMDLMYIQDYSFLLDIKLMLEMVRVVFDHRSSEEVQNDGRILSSDVGVRQGKSSLSKRID